MLKSVYEQLPIQWSNNIQLYRIVVDFCSKNDARVPIYNGSMYQGMLYNLIEDINPRLAMIIHSDPNPKQWSYSLFHLNKFSKANRKGFYTVRKKTAGKWFLNTTNKAIAESIVKGRTMYFGKMELNIDKVNVEDKSLFICPEQFRSISIKIHSPTVFYRASEKQYYPLNEENILKWQLHKFKSLGLVYEFDIEEIIPYLRILKKDTKPRAMHKRLGNDELIRIEGAIGYLTIKINGGQLMKELLWNLFHIGQYLGLGSNTNIGFGHYSIVNINK